MLECSFDKLPYETPHALELHEIPKVVDMFVNGAKRAVEANFDGIELHAGTRQKVLINSF